jgi:hypothetical protein
MVYKSKSKVIDLLYSNMCQVTGLLCPVYYIKNHPNKTKRVVKPKFSNMKAKDI